MSPSPHLITSHHVSLVEIKHGMKSKIFETTDQSGTEEGFSKAKIKELDVFVCWDIEDSLGVFDVSSFYRLFPVPSVPDLVARCESIIYSQ